MLLLRARLVRVEGRVLDGGGRVVGAALAVLVWLGLQAVFVLGVFAGQEDASVREGPDGAGEGAASEVHWLGQGTADKGCEHGHDCGRGLFDEMVCSLSGGIGVVGGLGDEIVRMED